MTFTLGLSVGNVLLASLVASSLLVLLVWAGLHSDRAELRDGQPPWWAIIGGLAVCGLFFLAMRLEGNSPFLRAFLTVFLGMFGGAGWTYLLLRWIGRRPRRD